MRLFAGLPLSIQATDQIAKFRLRLASPGDGLRWSNPDQWHITLRFFGEVGPTRVAAIKEGLLHLHAGPAPIALTGIGLFAAKGILHAEVELSPELAALQAEVEERTRASGELPDTHPFRPHVTLARSKGKTGLQTLRRLGRPELPSLGAPICWTAEEVLLFESTLGPGGAKYTVQARTRLLKAPDVSATD
jgi:2'-5' RNA ligase